MRKALLISAAIAAAGTVQAQLIFTALNTPQTITFQTAISNTLSYNATVSYGSIRETYAASGASYSDQLILRSLGWSVRRSGTAIAGNPSGAWTPFAAEIEVPPDTSQDHFVVPDMAPAAPSGSYSGTFRQVAVMGAPGGSERGWALGNSSGAPFADFGATLRSQNATGGTVTGFKFSMDAWYGDPDTSFSNLTLSYSTDNTSYTSIGTYNGFRTTTATFDPLNINHWSSNFNPNGTVTGLSLANGGYLYFRIETLRPGGSGSGGTWVLDNVQLELIPEPATVGLLLTVAPLMWLRHRRARHAARV